MDTETTCLTKTAEELAALRKERGPGLSDDQLSKTQEPLGKIEVAPNAFQHREKSYRPWDKEGHIKKLVKALEKQDGLLDPLLLYAIDGHRIVLDGHCRVMAYRAADLDESTLVPVEYFRGEFRDAFKQPAARNSKETLNMTQRERLEAAWSAVLFDEKRGWYSCRDIERFTTVSKSTVNKMRQELRNDDKYEFDPRNYTWYNFKRKRRDQREVDENWEEDLAHAWADRLRTALGNKPRDTPEAFFHALEIAYESLIPDGIPHEWAEASGAVDLYREEAEPVEDFKF